MMFQQCIAEDHTSLPPEVEALIIETPVLIQEEEQDERPATQRREVKYRMQKMMMILSKQLLSSH